MDVAIDDPLRQTRSEFAVEDGAILFSEVKASNHTRSPEKRTAFSQLSPGCLFLAVDLDGKCEQLFIAIISYAPYFRRNSARAV